MQPVSSQATTLFYARLFELDPSIRPIFRGDMAGQGRQLMQALDLVIRSLDSLDALLPAIRELGAQQCTGCVSEEHCATVGVALLWALAKVLGPALTAEVRDAWISVYTLLANTMLEGAAPCAA